ncbi:hypothetical protein HYPSUDRAFT_37929 [Hypholoma sublateritium FD-334 SS-4]|uniref:Uncharacterized protein n=1 Tax=Hypholoma sublateritium (strain FD-334 SS-4) TaxID=945553 RepID=A0A0D2MM53_HYPSF|nr:hypothetical protein HYPSUDRAFT_37929 [Hypholoma sublateritium FD-334 SS-4]
MACRRIIFFFQCFGTRTKSTHLLTRRRSSSAVKHLSSDWKSSNYSLAKIYGSQLLASPWRPRVSWTWNEHDKTPLRRLCV